MSCVLAVDGGNTKTIALVAGLDGTILGVGHAGCSDIYNAVPEDAMTDPAMVALANLERAVIAALRAAGVEPADLLVSVFNMAGADWPEDISFWRNQMVFAGMGQRIIAQNDALGILYAESPDATGVSIVCGTGAATGARSPDGREWHSSFWQDEAQGSAHLGQKTLFAVYRVALGIEPESTLTNRVLDHFAAASVEEVLHRFHNRDTHQAPPSVHQLTPILLDEADAGDQVALAVVGEHGARLGDIALAAARKVGIVDTAYPLVLAGGVFRHPSKTLENAIVEQVLLASPLIRPVRSRHEPIVGVLVEALRAAGVTTDQSHFARVYSSLPEGPWQRAIP
jgi:N-acetylglucosamine kinase-like BadF-type ATPase